jgi:hypothetical protein
MNFTLQLTADQITIIGKALGAGVFNEVAPIVQAIQAQVDQQLQAAQQAPEAPVAPNLGTDAPAAE